MRQWVNDHFPLLLSGLLLLGCVGSVVANRLGTPTRRLMVFKGARRFYWPLQGLLLPPIISPFFNTTVGVTFLVVVCFSASKDLSTLWFARALGEDEYLAVLEKAAMNSSQADALVPGLVSAAFVGLAGSVMLFLSRGPSDWAFYSALAVIGYAIGSAAMTCRDVFWIFRRIPGRMPGSPTGLPSAVTQRR